MFPRPNLRSFGSLAAAAFPLLAALAQPESRVTALESRPMPVAETRLLMQGINMPNFRGLAGMLGKAPADADAWTFIRGQALLIAESGNLLLLRPPRRQGRDVWMDRAVDLREAATQLARAASARDLESSRNDMTALASTCNRCHQAFRVSVRINASGDPPLDPARRKPIP